MTPDECPLWTVVDVGGNCVLLKTELGWQFTDTGGIVTQEAVEQWYDEGRWTVRALPVPEPRDREEWSAWRDEDEHEFMRFGAGADFRHTCAMCRYPRRHPIHGLEYGEPRSPKRVGNDSPSAESVAGCYASLMDTLDEYNEMVPEEDRVMIPFALQDVLADYIAEREAIQSIYNQEDSP